MDLTQPLVACAPIFQVAMELFFPPTFNYCIDSLLFIPTMLHIIHLDTSNGVQDIIFLKEHTRWRNLHVYFPHCHSGMDYFVGDFLGARVNDLASTMCLFVLVILIHQALLQ
jgi:hypothetical protein